MRGIRRRLAAALCALVLCLCAGGLGAGAEEAPMGLAGAAPASEQAADGETASALASLLDRLLEANGAASVQEWIDGALTREAGNGAEWEIMALAQSGEPYDFSEYEEALLRYLSENEVRAAASRQKYALTLVAIGGADTYISRVLYDSIGEQGIASWVFGMHLLHNGYAAPVSLSEVRDEILSRQLPDGGWAVTGQSADADMTAMAVQALAPLCDEDADVRAAVDRALELLSVRQLADGDFSSYGVPNAESTAQVMLALSALDVDWRNDSRFVKNGCTLLDGLLKYRLPDGHFCHTAGGAADGTATEQALFALMAAQRQEAGQGPMYLFDRRSPERLPDWVPPETGTDAPAADGTGAEPGNSAGADGTGAAQSGGADGGGYKLWVSLGILGVAGLVCLGLFVCKKRHPANFIVVAAVAAIAVLVVCLTDIQSPESYYRGTQPVKENAVGSVTLTIRCDTVAGQGQSDYIPADGVILEAASFAIGRGDTVYDILLEAAQAYGIRLDGSADYISGIQYLYEFDFGELSGWVYLVNGVQPSVGCGEYRLSDGDRIEWLYSLELGRDLPGYTAGAALWAPSLSAVCLRPGKLTLP